MDRGEIRIVWSSSLVASPFRDLVAYKLSFEMTRDLHRAVARWCSEDRWSIGIQLVRASGSVGANIAEGTGRWTRADQRHFIRMARGSLYETEHWLTLARELGLLDNGWSDRLDNAARALNGLLRRWPTA